MLVSWIYYRLFTIFGVVRPGSTIWYKRTHSVWCMNFTRVRWACAVRQHPFSLSTWSKIALCIYLNKIMRIHCKYTLFLLILLRWQPNTLRIHVSFISKRLGPYRIWYIRLSILSRIGFFNHKRIHSCADKLSYRPNARYSICLLGLMCYRTDDITK